MTAPSHRPIDYAHYFPWTRLFRSFRIATDPRKLILAALAVTTFWAGEAALSLLPFAPDDAYAAAPWNAVRPTLLIDWNDAGPTLFESPAREARSLTERVLSPAGPIASVAVLPFGRGLSWPDAAWIWTRLFWALAVWSVFGGAIARLAAIEFARDERAGMWSALTFAARRFVSFFSAPLLPLAGVLLLWGICAVGGLVGRIPYAGAWLVAAAWGLAVAIGLLVVLIAILVAAGWPLMVAAVATESSDAFDGFSRASSYLYGRPWLFVWSVVVAVLIGVLSVAAVDTLAAGSATVAARTVATGMGEEAVDRLHASPPDYFAAALPLPEADRDGSTASILTVVWLSVLAALAVGFAASYFWTAATVIYFLLRRADDATHFDEVWLGEAEEDDALLPLAGIASTDQPVTEQPHHPTVSPPVTTG